MKERLLDAFQGALLGTFCGDALGMPFEGWPLAMMTEEMGEVTRMLPARLGAGTYTDDTQMMIAVGESLLEKKGVQGEDMALRLADAYEEERGYGRGAARVIERLKKGVPWDEAGKGLFPGGSYGNGAAMRIAPVALFYYDQPQALRKAITDASRITHTHPLGIEGAILQGFGVATALSMGLQGELNARAFLEEVKAATNTKNPELGRKIFLVEDLMENLATGNALSREEVVRDLGHGIKAQESVPTALYAFLSHPHSFQEALSYAVGLGGDTDTIGAMAGALAGAYHGLSGIPQEWIEALEEGAKGRKYVLDLAHRLLLARESTLP